MKVLRSPVLEELSGFVHGFALGPGGPDPGKAAAACGLRDIVTATQVHGSSVFFSEDRARGKSVEADSVAARERGLGVGVVTADCVPVLICFPGSGCVCAVHAGWRGTCLRIAANSLLAVCRRYSLRPEDAVAAIGPAIGKCCYEVGEDVASRFVSQFGGGDWLSEAGGGKFFLDLAELNRIELLDAGAAAVHSLGVCTFCSGLPSYRRDGDAAGRMISFVGTPA